MEYNDEYITRMSKSIMPISSKLLRKCNNHQLQIIILEREISFNKLREELLKQYKEDRKDFFIEDRLNLVLSYTQEQLLDKLTTAIRTIKKLKYKISKLREWRELYDKDE